MGNNEGPAPPKSDKTSSAVQQQEQPAVHPYPDWAAMHTYYGPGMMPSPYFNPTVAPGTAPHPYMWGPQALMAPPFGSPYAAIYPHGYAHPAMPHAHHAHYQGMPPTPMTSEAVVMATPMSMEMPAKSGNTDKDPSKKLKVLDSVSVGNSSIANATEGSGQLQSTPEGSTDGSDGNNGSRGSKSKRMRSSYGTASSGNGKVEMQTNPATPVEAFSKVPLGITVPVSQMDPRVVSSKVKAIVTPVPPTLGGVVPNPSRVSSELWMQDERELKREKRKQSNRESARRSRLRKQAETEELALKVETLTAENTNLRSEISRLTENSDQLRLENSTLMEKLKNTQSYDTEEISFDKRKSGRAPVVENFLSIIDNQAMISRAGQQDHDPGDKSTGKLRQLLDTNTRADAVAAS